MKPLAGLEPRLMRIVYPVAAMPAIRFVAWLGLRAACIQGGERYPDRIGG